MKDYGVVTVNLPPNLATEVKLFRNIVAAEDLISKEDKYPPHITICWGILDDDPKTVWNAVAPHLPFYVRLGTTKTFPPSQSSDGAAVVYVEAYSPFLKIMNQSILASIPTKPQEHLFSAHCTLAFVKPEAAYKYENNPALDGKQFLVNYVNLTDKQQRHTTIWAYPYRVEHTEVL